MLAELLGRVMSFSVLAKKGLVALLKPRFVPYLLPSFSCSYQQKGNQDVHVIMRGGKTGPNYAAQFVRDAGAQLAKAGLPQKIMVGNPGSPYSNHFLFPATD
jgi:hypothetical protein